MQKMGILFAWLHGFSIFFVISGGFYEEAQSGAMNHCDRHIEQTGVCWCSMFLNDDSHAEAVILLGL